MSALRVPRGLRGAPHHLGALALFLALVEGVTGALLSAHYVPTARDAHASVRVIVAEVPFGDLLRAVHARGADLLVVTVWATLLAAALTGGYRRARAVGWCALVGLGFVTLDEAFTGSLLPASRDGAAGVQVATATLGTLPAVGPWLRRAMLGGTVEGTLTLVRVWAAHAALLPGVATLLGAAMAWRLPVADDDDDPLPLTPHFATRAAALCTAASLALVLLAAYAAPEGGAPAGRGASGGAPPWSLGAPHAALMSLPPRMIGVPGGTVAVFGGVALALALAALPGVDPRAGRLGRGFALTLALAVLGGTVYARLA
ncbi:MAG: cytochrome b N-terminal domain-containing protein [Polyangiales bacterium]